MAFGLLSLPPELLREVIALSQITDLKAIRLACKVLELYGREFLFETIHVELLPESMERLAAISELPHLVKNVRTLEYCARQLIGVTSHEDFEYLYYHGLDDVADSSDDKHPTAEERLSYFRKYSSYVAAQEEFLKDSKLSVLFAQALPKFPQLSSIVVTGPDDEDNPGLATATSSIVRNMKHQIGGVEPLFEGGFHHEYLEAVFRAIFVTNIKLKCLQLKHGRLSVSFFRRAIATTPFVHSVFSKLKDLRIHLGRYHEITKTDDAIDHIRQLMPSCHNLEHLYISSLTLLWSTLDIIAPECAWSKLKSLELASCSIVEDDLVNFGIHHQPQLTRILLIACKLEFGKWSTLLKKMRHQFPEQVVEWARTLNGQDAAIFAFFATQPFPDAKDYVQEGLNRMETSWGPIRRGVELGYFS